MVRNDSQCHQLGNLQDMAAYAAVAAAGWRSDQLSNYLLAVGVSERRFSYIFSSVEEAMVSRLCARRNNRKHIYGQGAGIPDVIVWEQPLELCTIPLFSKMIHPFPAWSAVTIFGVPTISANVIF